MKFSGNMWFMILNFTLSPEKNFFCKSHEGGVGCGGWGGQFDPLVFLGLRVLSRLNEMRSVTLHTYIDFPFFNVNLVNQIDFALTDLLLKRFFQYSLEK